LSMSEVRKIVRCFENAGARAKISSIHVNGWFGNYDKLSMTDRLFKDIFHTSLKEMRNRVIFIGDSPNDTPMFAYFPQSVGVANIMRFNATLSDAPAWMTEKEGGFGFAEMAETLLSG
ncbi:MAG: HAD family hydrolase, partial [Desulfobacterales bacterium]